MQLNYSSIDLCLQRVCLSSKKNCESKRWTQQKMREKERLEWSRIMDQLVAKPWMNPHCCQTNTAYCLSCTNRDKTYYRTAKIKVYLPRNHFELICSSCSELFNHMWVPPPPFYHKMCFSLSLTVQLLMYSHCQNINITNLH